MTDSAKSTPNRFEVVQRDNAYQGFYKLDRVQLRHELFDGGMSPVINREIFVRHDAVCAAPFLLPGQAAAVKLTVISLVAN